MDRDVWSLRFTHLVGCAVVWAGGGRAVGGSVQVGYGEAVGRLGTSPPCVLPCGSTRTPGSGSPGGGDRGRRIRVFPRNRDSACVCGGGGTLNSMGKIGHAYASVEEVYRCVCAVGVLRFVCPPGMTRIVVH